METLFQDFMINTAAAMNIFHLVGFALLVKGLIVIAAFLMMFLIPPYVMFIICRDFYRWHKDCEEARTRKVTLDQLYEERRFVGDPRVPRPPFDLPAPLSKIWASIGVKK